MAAGLFLGSMLFGSTASADTWSEPPQTERWSEAAQTGVWSDPPKTEVWSEPPKTEIWSDPPKTEVWSGQSPQQQPAASVGTGASTLITIKLGSSAANVNGKAVTMQTAPVTIQGRTFVPLRFIAEALGAHVEWEATEQKITLTRAGQTVQLWVHQSIAIVNGKSVKLEAAPTVVQGTTVVPLRFIGESLQQEIAFDPQTQTITLKGAASSASGSPTKPAPTAHADASAFIGAWSLWVPGSMTSYYYQDTGQYATSTYTPGAGAGSLVIQPNGTYEMNHTLQGKGAGTWRLAKAGEVPGFDQAIILTGGPGDADWAVIRNPNGSLVLSGDSGGVYTDGSKIWIKDSEVTKGKP